MASAELTEAERLKFAVLSGGVALSRQAVERIEEQFGTGRLTAADYASTSGITLVLDHDIWVNAPIETYNPNFVTAPGCQLCVESGQLVLRGGGGEVKARFVPVPAYYKARNKWNEPYTSYAYTHTDRVRISPIEGCAMRCEFCNLPFEFKYRAKPLERLIDSVDTAMHDATLPASHILISGGTPARRHVDYLKQVYRAVITEFPAAHVDIMMVPVDGLFDLDELKRLGVNELSINIEIYNQQLARRYMPQKFKQGLDHYLKFIERAVGVLGPGRIRSMLLAGLEPAEDTLAGVQALAERGCVPVLSPFRPDPKTPLADAVPPPAASWEYIFLRSREIAGHYNIKLGPSCIPCMHNTLTLPDGTDHYYSHERPSVS